VAARRAQQGERMRRIGVLMSVAADGPEGQVLAAFRHGLQQLGWSEGRNADIDQYLRRSRLGRSSGLGR
jgi:putative ABC transport system substrate-binding protein